MSADCIFCKIVKGELPSCKIHEDEETLAFMDIGPIIKGHALVIPKRHYADIHDVPCELLERLATVSQTIARAQTNALKADGINIVQSSGKAAGQVVPHIHFHVIPRFNDDGHAWNWRSRSYADQDEMMQFAKRISNSL